MKAKYTIISLFLICLLAINYGCVQNNVEKLEPSAVSPVNFKIILAGDSTVSAYKSNSRPLAGWGEFIPFCFDDQITVLNYASGGASTRTFRDWHKWDKVMSAAKKGDYILIQFGHNDEKSHEVKKYTDPDTTYQENLKKYIKEARACGAIPILVTPPVRLIYDEKTGKLKESHIQSLWHAPAGTRKTSTTYHDAMRKVAKETNTPLLDLNRDSRKEIEALPSYEEMTTYYRFVKSGHKNYPQGIKDPTHFSVKGAALMTKCLADEIRQINIPLAEHLKPEKEITIKKLINSFNKKEAVLIKKGLADKKEQDNKNRSKINKVFSRVIDPNQENIPPKAGNIKWRYLGPGVGGSMFGIGINPTNPKIMITGGDMGAACRTEDGGKSWTMIGGPSGDQPGVGGTWDIQFAPANPNIVWLVGSSAFKSIDGGKTWRRNAPAKTFGGLAIDPVNSDIVYISEGSISRFNLRWVTGNVYKTINGGKSWECLTRPYAPLASDTMSYRNYSRIVIDPNSKYDPAKGYLRVYIAGRGGFCRSDDAGKSWKVLSAPFGRGQITDLVLSSVNKKSILFLAAAGVGGYRTAGVYKSTDNGETWLPVNNGLENIIEKQQKYSANKALVNNDKAAIKNILLAVSKKSPERVYLTSFMGSARTDNLGETWVPIAALTSYEMLNDGVYAGTLKDNKVFKNDFGGGFDGISCFAASDSDPDLIAITDHDEVTISRDAGKTWTGVSFAFGEAYTNDAYKNKNLPPNKYTHKVKNIGQHNIVCSDITMDPFNKKIYYAAFMDLGLCISRDGGVYWEHPTTGINTKGHAWSVVVDPENEGLVIVASKRYRKPTKIYRSLDKGLTWKEIGLADGIINGDLHTRIHSIAIDLNSPVNTRTIFAATTMAGVFKTINMGDTWVDITKNADDTVKRATVMKLNPDNSDIIYLGTETGLYKTSDGGLNWVRKGHSKFEKVETISICKTKPDTIYLTAHYPGENQYWGHRGIFKSTDSGESWREITPSFFDYVGSVAVNPYDSDYLYAANYLNDNKSEDKKMIIVRSKDGGETWNNIGNDVAFTRGANIVIDDFDPQHIFILTTFAVLEGWDNEAPTK